MNIGIDIDGVLTDYQRQILDYGIKMCVDEKWPINIDITKYLEENTFHWNKKQVEKFWSKYMIKYFTQSPVREFAPEVIKKLRQEGNKIYIITARKDEELPPQYDGKMEAFTRKWLKFRKIKYDELILATDKLPICLDKNIDVMIEDSPKNIQSLSNEIKVIRYDCPYNKDVNNGNTTIAYSWYHIYKIIKELKGE